jgi:hypothetical protein
MRILLNYLVAFVFIPLSSCAQNQNIQTVASINFNDTIRKTETSLLENGDTLKTFFTYYFKSTNPFVDTSSFFYIACNQPCTKENMYKVYFPRKSVVDFCDSIVNILTNEMNIMQADSANTVWGKYYGYAQEKSTYESIRSQAFANKNDEIEIFGELAILLERFDPFIVNPIKNDKPKFIMIEIEKPHYGIGNKTYRFKTMNGDTVYLAGAILNEVQDGEN